MNKINYLFMLTCILHAVSVTSQETKFNKDDLLGKWKSYKVTTLEGGDGSDVTFDEKPFRKKIMMNFIDHKTLFFSINGSEEYKMEYLLKDNQIIISHRKYTIVSLKDSILTLKEEKLLKNLIYMKKKGWLMLL